MDIQITEAQYEYHEKIINLLSKQFSLTSKLNSYDLYEEAHNAYLRALQTYEEGRGSLISHIYIVIQNHLNDHCKKEKRLQEKKEIWMRSNQNITYQEQEKQKLNEIFSKDLYNLIKITLDNFDTIEKLPPKYARGELTRILQKSGWLTSRIRYAMYILNKKLKQLEINSLDFQNYK